MSVLRWNAVVRAVCTDCVVGALLLNACYAWHAVELSPPRSFGENERVRVVRTNGSTSEVVAVRLVDDSLVSRRPGAATRVAIPITDIRRAETRRLNTGRTVLLVAGVAVAVYLAVGAFAASQMEFDIP
jgi:hypothetical protein